MRCPFILLMLCTAAHVQMFTHQGGNLVGNGPASRPSTSSGKSSASKYAAGLSSLPRDAQGPISAALGKDDPGYWVHQSAGGFRGESRRQALVAEFTRNGPEVRSQNLSWGMEMRGYGYGDALHPVKAVTPTSKANRVEYRRDGLTEWYENGPLGLEQGFTLVRRPGKANGQPLTLELELRGDLAAALEPGGKGLELRRKDGEAELRYTGLNARDATGRPLRSWLEVRREQLLIRVEDERARYPVAVDPWVQQAELTASDGARYDAFGYSVAVSSSTAVVGAWRHTVGSNLYQGAAYVFVESGGTWSQQAELTASDGAYNDAFGASVAVSGSTAVVGAPQKGAAYVFVESGRAWVQRAELTASDGVPGDGFGWSVAVSGSTAVVGAISHPASSNLGPGAAYVFVETGGTWSQQAELTASDGSPGEGFGGSVAISGSTAVVGAPQRGAAYVFVESGGTWSQQAELTASDGSPGEGFGGSVAISGSTAVVGAASHPYSSGSPGPGAAYVFVESGGAWSQQAELTPSDGAPGDNFGSSVGASSSTAVVGAFEHPYSYGSPGPGAAYVFVESGGTWSQQAELTASDGAYNDAFGASVAVSGSTAVVGASGSNGFQAAYVFSSGQAPCCSPPSFVNVPGALTQISVGADGSVWGLNGSQQIFTYNSSAQSWTNIPGSLTHIAVGSSNAVWGLNENEQIYRWDSAHSQWINIPGSLAQIAAGADGDVWGLNYQSSIYHYNAQTGFWTQVPGQLAHIAVGSAGAVYGINGSGGAFWCNPGTGYFEYLGGPAFTQIAVGPDGYAVGLSDGVAYGYQGGAWYPGPTDVSIAQIAMGTGASIYGLDTAGNIYSYNGQSRILVQVPGTLSSIAVGANGAVWGLNSSQEIFTLQNAPMLGYQTLNSIPGSLNQISVGADGSVWGVSANTVEYFNPTTQKFQAISDAPSLAQVSVGAGGKIWGLDTAGNIYQWDASSATFNNVAGQLNFIQVAANGSVWGINSAGQTFTYSNGNWTNILGTLASLSVGADATVWGINAQQQIYRFDGQSWVNVPGSLVQISVGSANSIWGINAQGEVYYYDNARGWVIIPGAYLTDISVCFDGTVWGVNRSGNLYQWNAVTQSFNFVGSGVTNVVAGNAAAVWALNTNSGAVISWF